MARKVYNQEFKSEAVSLADKKGINKAAADLGKSQINKVLKKSHAIFSADHHPSSKS